MASILGDLRKETGIELAMDYRPGVDTDQWPDRAQQYALAWPSTAAYLTLQGKHRPVLSKPIATSPVVIGMTPRAAAGLRTTAGGNSLSWADVADAAASGRLRVAMPDPRLSGSGLAALVGVATAAAGTGSALRAEDVICDRLRGFLTDHASAPTSTQLVDFVDGHAMVGEESSLLALNDSGKLAEPLELVYPTDGIVNTEHPLLLMDNAHRRTYDRVVEWLTSPAVQRRISERTLRRPLVPDVPRDPRLRESPGVALFFPQDRAVVDQLLTHYESPALGRPSQVIFVLDFSGSMAGPRITELRATFAGLSGADRSSTGRFLRFAKGETYTLVRFGGRILDQRDFTVGGPADLQQLNGFLAMDDFDDTTAVWSALRHAYHHAAHIDRAVSIVLMTDGMSNAGIGIEEFLAERAKPDAPAAKVRTFAVRYGDANAAELDRGARATGGRMIDAGATSLIDAFKEIRGCG